ncbi:MAG: PKD domain-containing protein [Sedimentisphaerales bacterium]|nr:PKD domain-containing protein [Sedimentisphaerales bacterium]
MQISVDGELRLEGVISANGANGQAVHTMSGGMPNRHIYYSGGGGSGGTVNINAVTVSGNGSVTAVGGNGGYTNRAGGGAGGRIAISCAEIAYDVNGVSVTGGLGLQSGESGTIFLGTQGTTVRLVRDMTIGIDETYFDGLDIVIDGCIVTINGHHEFNSLQIVNGGGIVHSQGDLGLELNVLGNVSIDEGCYLSADGRGYGAGTGPGAGAGGGNGGGAGHGGNGGAGGGAGGEAYDSPNDPNLVGSGGGTGVWQFFTGIYYYAQGGSGGGLIRVTVGGELRLDGRITADGASGQADTGVTGTGLRGYWSGGGGSGGAICLDVFRLSGTGSISAIGGDGGWLDRAGGGAGGRIAVTYSDPTSSFNASHISINGGNGLHPGACGTMWLNGVLHTCEFAAWIEAPENDSEFSPNDTVTFEAASMNGESPVTYTWTSNLDGYLGEGQTLSVSVLSGGLHTITLTGEDSEGASNQDHIFIQIGSQLVVTSSAGGSVVAPGEGVFVYENAELASISALADPGWAFDGWSGTAVDAGKVADPNALTTSIMVDGNYTLQANFVSEGAPELPDLAITADDIQLLPYDASDSTITIDAAIHNVGTAAASAVTVHFYEFNALLAEAEVVEIPAGDMRSVPITIPMPAAGERLIQVVLDPLDTVEELDETNNAATQILLINTGDITEGHILITGSVPSSVCRSSSFSVTGTAVYDLYVDGVRYTDYAVKGGMVEMTVIGPDGEQWLYGGDHTDIYGTFSQALQAPGTLGIYRLLITVTDNTFIGECELVFEVKDCSISNPPPPPPPHYFGGGSGSGSGSGYWAPGIPGGGSGTTTEWHWVWTTPPPNVPAADVYVYSEDIHFSITHPDAEQEITIFAEVHYWAESTDLVAYNVPINMYATYPGEDKIKIGETLIDEFTVGWPDFGSQYVFTTWKADREGIYIIEVEVDPSYSEQNMLNNAATRAIIVGDPGDPWGAIEGQVREALGGVDDVIMDLYDADDTILIESKVTGNGGYYLFTNLPAGTYQVHIRVPDGYVADAQTKPAEVVPLSITTVNFFLSQTEAPVADADGPYSGEVGSPVPLDAGGSYDPDGVIVSYEWDCNGDAEYDEVTSSPQMPYTWDTAYNGLITLRVTDNDGLTATDTAIVTITSPPLYEVGVDIYPNRIPNPVYLSRNYTIYVAVLGSDDFDVTTLDFTTVRFGRSGTEAGPASARTLRDLNNDGITDALCGFLTFSCDFQVGDTQGWLTGLTADGIPVQGSDSVVVMP